jgi:hypothetical protein
MAEVVLSSDELTVLGGPAEVKVEVDFGPQGDRGSLIFYGLGKPATFTPPVSVGLRIYDTYINLLSSDDEYRYFYQYTAGVTQPQWERRFKLIPNMYGQNVQKTFTNGEVDIAIPVAAIIPEDLLGSYAVENFNVQVNVLNTNPLSLATTVSEISIVNNLESLPINIKAIEYVDGAWSNLDGAKTIHVSITVV